MRYLMLFVCLLPSLGFSAVAIDMHYHVAQGAGRYVAVAATSDEITFNTHKHVDNPINWSTRYRQYQVGVPGEKVDVGGVAIKRWWLKTLPSKGELYDASKGVVVTKANYMFTDPDKLWYKPYAWFTGIDSFDYIAVDSGGQSNVATVRLTVLSPDQYVMPMGIHHPGFGFNERPPADPSEWPEREAKNYYYVDSDHGSCVDKGNEFGYPSKPRCSIPPSGTVVSAGGKIVLAESSKTYPLRERINWHQWKLDGEIDKPVWIVGNESDAVKPVIEHAEGEKYNQLRLTGSYWRITGIDFDSVRVRTENNEDTNTVVRHSIMRNLHATSGSYTGFGHNNSLSWNIAYFDNGVIDLDLERENDVQDMGRNKDGNNHWFIDNLSYASSGDGFLISNTPGSSNHFLGRINFHSHSENCIDIKTFNNVVVSESDCYDLRRTVYGKSKGNAQAFYLNDEGPQAGFAYFINNRCWDTSGVCFSASNLKPSKSYFIGNVVLWAPKGVGFSTGTGDGEKHVALNTFANVEIGMSIYTSGSTAETYYMGNIIHGASDSHMRMVADYSNITLSDYNAISGKGVYKYGSASVPKVTYSLREFKEKTGKCKRCKDKMTPVFADESVYDFSLIGGSVVDLIPVRAFMIGKYADHSFYDLYRDLGVALSDIKGVRRPQAGYYDAGAYESIRK